MIRRIESEFTGTGGTGPTASLMKADRVRETIGFTTRDEADGARFTSAPSHYEKHERWK